MANDELRLEQTGSDPEEGVRRERPKRDPIGDISGSLRHLAPRERVTVEAMRRGILRKAAETHRGSPARPESNSQKTSRGVTGRRTSPQELE
jgi:hypothetical protein